MNTGRGFSLLELVVVLLILAILVTVALPGYRQSVVRANRAVARLVVLEVAARQERFLQTHSRYAASLAQLGLDEPYLIDGTANPVSEQHALYAIHLLLEEADYRGVVASPRGSQVRDSECGSFVYLITGERQVSGSRRDNPGRCW